MISLQLAERVSHEHDYVAISFPGHRLNFLLPSGQGATRDNCVNNLCVGQRFGRGGDYMGMAVVPAGEYDDDHERFAPAWQDSATPTPVVNMSFVDVLE